MFYYVTLPKTNFSFSVTFNGILWSASYFNLEQSENLSYGKALREFCTIFIKIVGDKISDIIIHIRNIFGRQMQLNSAIKAYPIKIDFLTVILCLFVFEFKAILNLSQTTPGVYVSAVQVF